MRSSFALRAAGLMGVAGAVLALAEPAFAQAAAPAAPTVSAGDYLLGTSAASKGDTGFMLVASVLVLFMTVPGLALFYGGLVRTKNMLSVLMQVTAILCLVSLIWVTYGYSMAFTNGGEFNSFIGGFSKVFLTGVTASSPAATFSNGVYLPEYVFILFQMTFACITPALIVGAFAERVKFSALLVFTALWVTFIYFPMAHMVWYWAGPDFLKDNPTDFGLLWGWGALDFAGGTVVHINAGIAGLVGALIIGRRIGYRKEAMPPHSLVMSLIGAGMLWVGWFGFNVGSNLEANGIAALAAVNTFVATAAAGIAWMLWEWITHGKPSLLGLISGLIAGLVAITPACGFAGPMGAIVLGFVAGVVCNIFSTGIKNLLGYDDSLDVFGIHGIGGIIGAIGTGIVAAPVFGGQGLLDFTQIPYAAVPTYDIMAQVIIQAKAVGVTILLSGFGSAILFKIVDIIIGLRPSEEKEREGLDVADHGERAYNY